MPEIRLRAPALTFVAVRATVPVTADAAGTAPTRCSRPSDRTSSQLERWRRPVMPSATTRKQRFDRAEQREQIALGITAAADPNRGSASSGRSRSAARSEGDPLSRQAA